MDILREGDTVIVTNVDAADGLNISKEIKNKKCTLITLNFSFDTKSVEGKFMSLVFADISQMER